MAQQFQVGLRGLLKPEVDDRASRQVQKDVEEDLSEVEQLQPELDASSMEQTLEEFDMGGALGEMDGGFGDMMDGGRGGPSGGASTAGGLLAGAGGSGLAKIALGGAVAVGMLGALNKTKNLLMSASPALQSTSGMFGEAMNLFFRPFGNFLSETLRPMATAMLEMAKNFNQSVGENGLSVAVVEGLSGIDFDENSLGEQIGSAIGFGGGAAAGGLAGAKAGGALGATAGSIIPGAGTAAGGTAGAIIGAIVGAIGGSAIGARVGEALGGAVEDAGSFLGDQVEDLDIPEFPGWPDLTGSWPGWPDLSQNEMLAEIGWPSIGTSDWLSQADWPSVGVGNLLGQIGWPSIPGSGLLGEVSWPQVGAGLLLGVVSWPTIGVSALLSRPSWPSIGTNSLIGEVGWPSITAGSIVGSIDWPTIDASAITSRFGNNTDNNDSDSGLLPFANGGVVTGPTNALIGEAGPEAVIPLDRLNEVMGSQQGASNAQSSARGQATSEDIRRLEDQLRTVVSELQNMGGDIVLQVGQRELGAASTESTQKFQRAREVTK